MKRTDFWIFAPVLGLCAMILRWLVFTQNVDSRGLLVPGSLAEWLLLAVCAAMAVLAFLAKTPRMKSDGKLSGMANWVLALGMGLPQARGDGVALGLWQLFRLGSLLSLAALLVLGLFRFREKKPPFGLNAMVCVGFFIRLVAHYQLWSRMPQMQSYVFALFALILLAAFSYQQTAAEVGMGTPRWRLRFGLLGCFACLTAAVGATVQPFYLCAGLWLLGCTLFEPPIKNET